MEYVIDDIAAHGNRAAAMASAYQGAADALRALAARCREGANVEWWLRQRGL
jgi:hypothetical protein